MNIFIHIKDFLYYNRKTIIIGGCLLVLIFLSFTFNPNVESTISYEEVDVNEKIIKTEPEIEYIFVDIKGEVQAPGIYEMTLNDRVIDVIKKAGGLTEKADTTNINLSQKLKDEMVIFILAKGENETNKVFESQNNINSTVNNKISINKAELNDLMKIKGLGKVKAQNIIDYRKTYGLFKSLEDIKKVSGIGDSTYEKIKDYITL